ncbi:hypothetical protein DHEL01_v212498 [Diaporthe helianthi]|uniref:Uncharacterized protein n=1 Tax=Diaporthe helianthi TaxID=158607 RepID=A0A2P5HFT3_DIAHE|nr:hypothetical protein DHEL01_v212498 [Diaporthe helianthi]
MATRPKVDLSDPAYVWPHKKFNLPQDALFTTLYDQHNQFTIPIQDPIAFHHDVYESASIATSIDQLHTLLQERKIQRLNELWKCWDKTAINLVGNPSLLLNTEEDMDFVTDNWAAFLQLARERSLDALCRYFSLFFSRNAPPPPEPPSNPTPDEPIQIAPTQPSQKKNTEDVCEGRAKRKFTDEHGDFDIHRGSPRPAKRKNTEDMSKRQPKRRHTDQHEDFEIRRSSRIATGNSTEARRTPRPPLNTALAQSVQTIHARPAKRKNTEDGCERRAKRRHMDQENDSEIRRSSRIAARSSSSNFPSRIGKEARQAPAKKQMNTKRART